MRRLHDTPGDERRVAVGAWFFPGLALGALWSTVLAAWLGGGGLLLARPGLLGALVGGVLAVVLARWLAPQWPGWHARATLHGLPLGTVREAREGRVRLRGRALPIRLATSQQGRACLAFEYRAEFEASAANLFTEGGVFALDDGSGVRAVVRAGHVAIAGGCTFADEVVIPPGVPIEVAGTARWIVAESEETLPGHPRAVAHVLEIAGTSADPVIVRTVEPPESAPLVPPAPALRGFCL
jgi:hypothetical protein